MSDILLSSSSTSCLPQILWNLASPIHDNDITIPFSQCISIHQTLLDAISYGEQSSYSFSLSDDFWESWIAVNLHNGTQQDREAEKAKKKLLLLLQVLLYESPNLTLGKRLTDVFFPFLEKMTQDCDEDDEGFCEALLNVVFEMQTVKSGNTSPSSSSSALSSPAFSSLRFSWKCRVLDRVQKTEPNNVLILKEWILPMIFKGMASLETVPCIIKWLVPLIIPSEECLELLWNQCLEFIRIIMDSTNKKNTHKTATVIASPLVVSAILCTSISSMIPIITRRKETKDELWNFFLYLLQSGTKHARMAKKGGNFNFEMATKDQLLRRRGLFLVQTWMSTKQPEHGDDCILKYIMVFETLEMEAEPHLIDQVWDMVADLCLQVQHQQQESSVLEFATSTMTTTPLTWDWISALFGRIFVAESPMLRKLGFFRFLNNEAGIQVFAPANNTSESLSSKEEQRRLLQKRSSKNRHAISFLQKPQRQLATLSILAPDFVSHVLIFSWDTLMASIGTRMNYQDDSGRMDCQDLTAAFLKFLVRYVQVLEDKNRSQFVESIIRLTNVLRPKSAVFMVQAVADGLSSPWRDSSSLVTTAAHIFQRLVRENQVILAYRQQLLHSLARILSTSTRSNGHSSKRPVLHEAILQLLSLYVTSQTPILSSSSFSVETLLSKWVQTYNTDDGACWTLSVAGTCASAFCQLHMLPTNTWDPVSPTTETEELRAASIVLLAKLSDNTNSATATAASCLWPAIYKGFKNTTSPQRTNRALLLLVHGCRMGILSGIGNGDLVVQQQIPLPPPPNIDGMVQSAIDFLFSLLESLFSPEVLAESGCSQTALTHQVASTFSHLIKNQLQVLANSYPSSSAIFAKVASIQETSIQMIIKSDNKNTMDTVLCVTLLYASLVVTKNTGCKGDHLLVLSSDDKYSTTHDLYRKLLSLHLMVSSNSTHTKYAIPTALSVYPSARWGCLSFLLPQILREQDDGVIKSLKEKDLLLQEIFAIAHDLVGTTPVDALLSLFDTVKIASLSWFSSFLGTGTTTPKANNTEAVLQLNRIIDILFSVLTDMNMSSDYAYILNEMCALLFQPSVLYDEYQRLKTDSEYEAPIRRAFEKLVTLSGTSRSHILHAAVRHASVGWLGDDEANIPAGLGAIPYVNSIANLLVHKEQKLDISAVKQSVFLAKDEDGSAYLQLPPDTNECSATRGYILIFFSRLPLFESTNTSNCDDELIRNLLHPLILHILGDFCFSPLKNGKDIMTGTPDYSLRIRSWQALSVLSRFIANDENTVVRTVVDLFFQALSPNLHNEIRYFVEIFGIQLGRQHPQMVAHRLIQELNRVDLSLQHVTSLMIVAGYLAVGRYQLDCLKEPQKLHKILAGVIPCLSSAQGFSRAIAQFLVYSIVPRIVDVAKENDENWYLTNIYRFLDENMDMHRLRIKLLNLFERYDADLTVDELLSIPVDEGDEADPEHAVDFIKQCLDDAYLESHAHDPPAWKQVNELHRLQKQKESVSSSSDENRTLANFQRKIIPLDALNISHSTRQERLSASKRQHHSLVLCASLLTDQVPMLAGLARTAEIFAAESLVIPDLGVVRMDSFQTISVTAADWIPIEECPEHNLVSWIQLKQKEGYTIIGVEQNLSSTNISNFEFPQKTILLLGKEKEGIPIPYSPFVEHCIQIPPLGIIRSLNVHVSGAICIWEYSKQSQLPSLIKTH